MKKIILISILVLIIDIISKQLVLNLMIEYQSINIIPGFFNLTLAKNTGIAFSFLEGKLPLIIIMTMIIIFIILKYLKLASLNKYESICYGLIVGGAIGNLLDRIIYHYVIDFLDFKIFNYSFPIFNLADTAIVIGVILLIILSLIEESRKNNENNSSRKYENR